MGCVLNRYVRLQAFRQSAAIQSLELHVQIHLCICLLLYVSIIRACIFSFHWQHRSNADPPPVTARPF